MHGFCACGLPFTLRKKAKVCAHCDGVDIHVAARCDRCQKMLPKK